MKKLLATIITLAFISMIITMDATAFIVVAVCYSIMVIINQAKYADPFEKGICIAVYMIPAIILLLRSTPGELMYVILTWASLGSTVILSWVIAFEKNDS